MAEHELLCDGISGPRAVRVAGLLDSFSTTRLDIVLALPNGETVAARIGGHDCGVLEGLLGSRVVVSGMTRFLPTGRLLTLDVEYISAARDADSLFETTPVATESLVVVPSVPREEWSVCAEHFGTWPGDETEEDLLEALKGLRMSERRSQKPPLALVR